MSNVTEKPDLTARPVSRALLEQILSRLAACEAAAGIVTEGRGASTRKPPPERYTRAPWRIDSVAREGGRVRYTATLMLTTFSDEQEAAEGEEEPPPIGYAEFPGEEPVTTERLYADPDAEGRDVGFALAGDIVWALAVITVDDEGGSFKEHRFTPSARPFLCWIKTRVANNPDPRVFTCYAISTRPLPTETAETLSVDNLRSDSAANDAIFCNVVDAVDPDVAETDKVYGHGTLRGYTADDPPKPVFVGIAIQPGGCGEAA